MGGAGREYSRGRGTPLKELTDMTRYNINLDIHIIDRSGQPCFQVGKKKGTLLVRRTNPSEPWEPVHALEKGLSHKELVHSYGCWTDREVATGQLFWKKVIRPLDGEIQPDEVVSFADRVAYSWESHTAKNSFELPHIELLTLSVNPSRKGPIATLQEIWRG